MKILIINGVNLNLLGQREPEIYGSFSLSDLEKDLKDFATANNIEIYFFQSNHEGEIVESIHQAKIASINYIIINPGAYTHTSIAIRDALIGVSIPFIEVHISNIFSREEFRKHSYLSDKAKGIIAGLGIDCYKLAIQYCLTKN